MESKCGARSAGRAARRVVVSGGNGFLGSFVVEKLRAAGCQEISTPRSREYDLREKSEALRLYKAWPADGDPSSAR